MLLVSCDSLSVRTSQKRCWRCGDAVCNRG